MKNKKYYSLVFLYLGLIFKKTTLIIISISLVLMISIMIYYSKPNVSNSIYLENFKDMHNSYLNNSIFIIGVFNSIIVTSVVVSLILDSESFDILFVSYINRNIISKIKLLSILIVLSLLVLIEAIILFIIPIIRFELYKPDTKDFLVVIYLLISVLFLALIESVISLLIKSIFSPMIILFISIIVKSFSLVDSLITESLKPILPIIYINRGNIYFDSIFLSSLFIILFVFIYVSVYNVKDLK